MTEKKKVEKVAQVEQVEENPGFSWWILLGAVVGFAVLSLVGAGVLVFVLSLG